MDVNELLIGPRQGGADFHVVAGSAWLEAGEDSLRHSALAYGAFEFRCAIERVVFELYYVLRDRKLEIEEARAIGTMRTLLLRLHEEGGGNKGELYRRLKFNAIYADEQIELPRSLAVPDAGRLHRLWAELSDYCHAQFTPGETWDRDEWVAAGYTKLREANEYLRELLVESVFGALVLRSLPEEALDLREKYLQGEIDEDSVRSRLRLMKAVIETRPPWLLPDD